MIYTSHEPKDQRTSVTSDTSLTRVTSVTKATHVTSVTVSTSDSSFARESCIHEKLLENTNEVRPSAAKYKPEQR